MTATPLTRGQWLAECDKLAKIYEENMNTTDLEEALTAKVERLRGLLREAEVKLTDVQGAYATKRYADNLLARIRAALAGDSHE